MTTTDGAQIIPRTTIAEVTGARSKALAAMQEAVSHLARGFTLAQEAQALSEGAAAGFGYYEKDRAKEATYKALFPSDFNEAESLRVWRQHLDARIWMRLLSLTGMGNLMDRTAMDKFREGLEGDVPEVDEATVYATFDALRGDAKLIFQRGVARAFAELDRRFRSHDGWKLGSRLIFTRVFDSYGFPAYSSRWDATFRDVERVFAVLDGKALSDDHSGAYRAMLDSRKGASGARQAEAETEYFRIRTYQNGNAHLWFTRDDLVDKVNRELADYYGAVLPDAAPHPDELRPEDLRSQTGALSRDLAFYPTPLTVAALALSDLDLEGLRVLEPSAGEGALVRALFEAGAKSVTAIEVDAARHARLSDIPHPFGTTLSTRRANFLTVTALPATYDTVVMNPPFCGTHWMQHVLHAWDFLRPGGTLLAILPVTAETGDSKRHETFRAWAQAQGGRYAPRPFTDLPPESFAASGTRINTVVLRLTKPR